jgi:hypothetical protein
LAPRQAKNPNWWRRLPAGEAVVTDPVVDAEEESQGGRQSSLLRQTDLLQQGWEMYPEEALDVLQRTEERQAVLAM